MKTLLLPLLLGILTLPVLPLRAADEEKKDGAAEAAAEGELSQVKLGDAIANGPVTMDDLKGKAVVIEFWGIH